MLGFRLNKLGAAVRSGLDLRSLYGGGASGFLPAINNPDRVRQTYNTPATTSASAGDPTGLWLPQAPGGEAVDNLLLQTDNIASSSWVKSQSSGLSYVSLGRDSTPTMGKLVEASDVAQVHYTNQNVTVTAGTNYTFGVDLKAGERTRVRLVISAGGGGCLVDVNLGAGTIGTPAAFAGGTVTAATIALVSTGIYRATLTGYGASGTTAAAQVELLDGAGSRTYNGDGVSGAFIGRMNLNLGSSELPYQPNAGCLGGSNRRTGGVNLLVNTETLATQNVTVIAQAYTLNFTGAGTVTLSGAHTAGPLSAGTTTFTPSAGTLTLTVSGSVTQATLQIGSSFTGYSRNMEVVGGLLTSAVLYQNVSGNRGTRARRPLSGIRNRLSNNMMTGAAATATRPTGWIFSTALTGLTVTNTASSVEDGITYFDVTFSGAPSGAGSYQIFFDSTTAITAANGDTWTNSVFLKLQAGALTGVSSIVNQIQDRTSVGGFLSGYDSSAIVPTSASLATQRNSQTATLTGGGTVARVISNITLTLSGAAVSFTLRIGMPQLEKSSSATAVQSVVSLADITEAGQPDVWHTYWDGVSDYGTFGVQSFGSASLFAAPGQAWTVWGVFRTLTSSAQTLIGKCGATDAARTLQVLVNGSTQKLMVYSRGASQNVTSTTVNDGAFHVWALRWNGTSLQFYFDRVSPFTCGVDAAVEEVQDIVVSARTGGVATFFNGHNDVALIDRALSDAEIAQLMSNLNAVYRAGL